MTPSAQSPARVDGFLDQIANLNLAPNQISSADLSHLFNTGRHYLRSAADPANQEWKATYLEKLQHLEQLTYHARRVHEASQKAENTWEKISRSWFSTDLDFEAAAYSSLDHFLRIYRELLQEIVQMQLVLESNESPKKLKEHLLNLDIMLNIPQLEKAPIRKLAGWTGDKSPLVLEYCAFIMRYRNHPLLVSVIKDLKMQRLLELAEHYN